MHWLYAFLLMPQFPLQAEFFENLFPQDKRGGENYSLIYQNSIRKSRDDLEHYLYFEWFIIFDNKILIISIK